MFGYCYSSNVEGCNREDTQNAEEEEGSIGESLRKVCTRFLHEGQSFVAEHASCLTESARNKTDDGQQDKVETEAEKSLISDNLEGLQVVLGQQFLLEHEEEAVEEEGGEDEDISDCLETLG